jgi:ATP-dependent helicase Lhr and Lhr-like helicase
MSEQDAERPELHGAAGVPLEGDANGVEGFDVLAPGIQHHVVNTLGWPGLRPLQEQAAGPLVRGEDALLLAPTAGGKTEAAVLPVLTRMTREAWQGTSVLYVCPIRALLNNLEPRLSAYTGWLGRRAEVRHGDTTAGQRRRQAADRPDVLLTTPESLESMLVSTTASSQAWFSEVRAVIVDEVHAFAGDDRGWHLQGVLQRIEDIAGRSLQRIGLSATVGNPEELLHWLQAARDRPGRVIDPGGETPPSDVQLDWVKSLDNATTVIAALHQGEKRLVFADSRRAVEDLALGLRNRDVTTFVSHSSLSVDERRRAERAFAEERDCVITATSTLELGIDVGDLDRCVQVGAPHSVSSMLQRLGRTGRRSGSNRNMLFLETGDEDFLRALGLLQLWGEGFVEAVTPPPRPYHVAAQQILGHLLQQRALDEADLDAWFHRQPMVSVGEWRAIRDHMLAQGYLGRDGHLLFVGPMAELRYGGVNYRDIMAVFSADPQMLVLHGRVELGTIDPMVLRTPADGPRNITLGGRAWKVGHVDWRRHRVFVEPSTAGGRLRWPGSARPMSLEMTQAVRRVLLGADLPGVRLTSRAEAKLAEVREEYGGRVAHGAARVLEHAAGGDARWWTFAGARENGSMVAALTRTAPELLERNVSWNDWYLTVHPEATAGALNEAWNEARAQALVEPTVLDPMVDDRALAEVKFGGMVPPDMLRRQIAAR